MHPLLAKRGWLMLYLLAWGLIGLLLAVGLTRDGRWLPAAALFLPLGIVYGFVCLSAWYVCRAFPIDSRTGVRRLVVVHLLAGAIAGAIWVATGAAWTAMLDASGVRLDASSLFVQQQVLLFVLGVLLFWLAVACHYLLIAFETSREAERRAIELSLLAREAELRALRAQIDPHFIFNSLHSISALTTVDPATARRMCLLLADFLRETLRLGSGDRISLADELALADRFLEIEQVRLGPRLQIARDIEARAVACLVPPLILQPLVENAVVHGIAQLVDGGTIRIASRLDGATLAITLENPCDPEPMGTRGVGLGLSLLKQRLTAQCGVHDAVQIDERDGRFRVHVRLPAVMAIETMTHATGAPMRVVVVDDEHLARDVLRELLAAHADVEIVAECANGFEAVKAVSDLAPDLLLLDIQMPKLDGFDVLDLIGGDMPVIFVTAYDSHAIRAFEVHAVDYLLKPFGADRLAAALERARDRMRVRAGVPVRELIAAARMDRQPIQRLLIKDRADVHIVPADKVDYLEAQDDYVAVKTAGKTYLKEQTLQDLEAQLDPQTFVRIHRRYVLNLARLARIELAVTDSRIAVLNDGTQLPISRTGYARLRELL